MFDANTLVCSLKCCLGLRMKVNAGYPEQIISVSQTDVLPHTAALVSDKVSAFPVNS